MTNYESHPLADLIPAMSAEEFKDLRNDIENHGLRDAIVLFEGKILDGRNRYRACGESGVTPRFEQYEGNEPVALVISKNIKRRTLTPSQLAMVTADLLPVLEEEARTRQLTGLRRGAESPSVPVGTDGDKGTGRASEDAAALTGAGSRSVGRAKRVSTESPELATQVRKGAITLRAAEKKMTADQRRDTNGSDPEAVLVGKGRANAEAVKRRVETLVGQCQGLARGLPQLKAEDAALVATRDEVAGWTTCIKNAESALRTFRKRLADKEQSHV